MLPLTFNNFGGQKRKKKTVAATASIEQQYIQSSSPKFWLQNLKRKSHQLDTQNLPRHRVVFPICCREFVQTARSQGNTLAVACEVLEEIRTWRSGSRDVDVAM